MPDLRADLAALADPAYRTFQARLLPTVDSARILGVRIPDLRRYARAIADTPAAAAFLSDLPHSTYDEDNLHAALLCRMRDRDRLVAAIDAFLPHVDNWATCDSLRPAILSRDPAALRRDCARWMADAHLYTCRFGIEMLMVHGLGASYDRRDLAAVGAIAHARGGEYYLAMMCAWYYATALATHADDVLAYLRACPLPPDGMAKTYRKACESRRVDRAVCAALRGLY